MIEAGFLDEVQGATGIAMAIGVVSRYALAAIRRLAAKGKFDFLPDWMEPRGIAVHVWLVAVTVAGTALLLWIGPRFGLTPALAEDLNLRTSSGWLQLAKAVVVAVWYNEAAKHQTTPSKKDPGT